MDFSRTDGTILNEISAAFAITINSPSNNPLRRQEVDGNEIEVKSWGDHTLWLSRCDKDKCFLLRTRESFLSTKISPRRLLLLLHYANCQKHFFSSSSRGFLFRKSRGSKVFPSYATTLKYPGILIRGMEFPVPHQSHVHSIQNWIAGAHRLECSYSRRVLPSPGVSLFISRAHFI